MGSPPSGSDCGRRTWSEARSSAMWCCFDSTTELLVVTLNASHQMVRIYGAGAFSLGDLAAGQDA